MAMEITKNLQTIERSLKAIKEAEFRINNFGEKHLQVNLITRYT